MRDLKRYPSQDPNVIILDENGIIYGHKIARQIVATGQAKAVATFRNISIDVFVAYLSTHFPNYECVKALESADQVTPKHLEAISYAIELTVGDATYIRDIQRGDLSRNN